MALPDPGIEIDQSCTALVITDPQNDSLSEGGVVRDLVCDGVKNGKLVECLTELHPATHEGGL